MGACDFMTEAHGTTVEKAYDNAVKDALHWHGHSPYSGTIKEKDGWEEFPLPASTTPQEVVNAICDWYEGNTTPLTALVGTKAERLAGVYWDKWGPAVAFRIAADRFAFCGMASC